MTRFVWTDGYSQLALLSAKTHIARNQRLAMNYAIDLGSYNKIYITRDNSNDSVQHYDATTRKHSKRHYWGTPSDQLSPQRFTSCFCVHQYRWWSDVIVVVAMAAIDRCPVLK